MPRSRVRGGRKAHNKRIKKRNEVVHHIEYLKKKIYEEAEQRYWDEQNKPMIKIKEDDRNDNS